MYVYNDNSTSATRKSTIIYYVLTALICILTFINVVNIGSGIWLLVKTVFHARGLRDKLYALFITPMYILTHYDLALPRN